MFIQNIPDRLKFSECFIVKAFVDTLSPLFFILSSTFLRQFVSSAAPICRAGGNILCASSATVYHSSDAVASFISRNPLVVVSRNVISICLVNWASPPAICIRFFKLIFPSFLRQSYRFSLSLFICIRHLSFIFQRIGNIQDSCHKHLFGKWFFKKRIHSCIFIYLPVIVQGSRRNTYYRQLSTSIPSSSLIVCVAFSPSRTGILESMNTRSNLLFLTSSTASRPFTASLYFIFHLSSIVLNSSLLYSSSSTIRILSPVFPPGHAIEVRHHF